MKGDELHKAPLTGTGLPARISRAMRSVWIRHTGHAPRHVETMIRANTVICRMSGGTVEFSEGMIETDGAVGGTPSSSYKTDAVAAVVGVTGQRVRFLISESDPVADVATERFTLEDSLLRGRPRRTPETRP